MIYVRIRTEMYTRTSRTAAPSQGKVRHRRRVKPRDYFPTACCDDCWFYVRVITEVLETSYEGSASIRRRSVVVGYFFFRDVVEPLQSQTPPTGVRQT